MVIYSKGFKRSLGSCTVRGDLIRILTTLAKKRDKFDLVLIETTGLADPAPVCQTFFVDADISDAYFLDAVITMVLNFIYSFICDQ